VVPGGGAGCRRCPTHTITRRPHSFSVGNAESFLDVLNATYGRSCTEEPRIVSTRHGGEGGSCGARAVAAGKWVSGNATCGTLRSMLACTL